MQLDISCSYNAVQFVWQFRFHVSSKYNFSETSDVDLKKNILLYQKNSYGTHQGKKI
jgi:hypothetical protein